MAPTQHPLESICKFISSESKEKPELDFYTDSDNEDQLFDAQNESHLWPDPTSLPASLDLSGIKSPAMLLDSDLRIAWQNNMAAEQVWHSTRFAPHESLAGCIFDNLLNPQFQRLVENWRQWTSFFVRQAADMMPQEEFDHCIDRLVHPQKEMIVSLAGPIRKESIGNASISNRLTQELANGDVRSFDVIAIDFSEGRLFVFKSAARSHEAATPARSSVTRQHFENIRRHPRPIPSSYSVMSTTIDNAAFLKTGLLSEEYCKLIHDVFRKCLETVETFGGIFCKHSDSGFLCHFISSDKYDMDGSIRAIECALALKTLMADLTREWKLRQTWSYEIRLNIGIHGENDYLGTLSSSVGDNLTSYGNAVSLAADLSRMAGAGQIWATKTLVNELPQRFRERLRFGIHRSDGHRNQPFVQNCFARIRDLHGVNISAPGFNSGLGMEVVTQLFDLAAAV